MALAFRSRARWALGLILLLANASLPTQASDHSADASPSIPTFLTGVWGTEDSLFQGDKLEEGEAVYIDASGNGLLMQGGGTSPFSAAHLRITSYDASRHVVTFDLLNRGKVVATNKHFIYDPVRQWLMTANEHYYHRFEAMTIEARRELGFDTKGSKHE